MEVEIGSGFVAFLTCSALLLFHIGGGLWLYKNFHDQFSSDAGFALFTLWIVVACSLLGIAAGNTPACNPEDIPKHGFIIRTTQPSEQPDLNVEEDNL